MRLLESRNMFEEKIAAAYPTLKVHSSGGATMSKDWDLGYYMDDQGDDITRSLEFRGKVHDGFMSVKAFIVDNYRGDRPEQEPRRIRDWGWGKVTEDGELPPKIRYACEAMLQDG